MKYFFILLLVFVSALAVAQKDTSTSAKDSFNTAILAQQQNHFKQLEQIRLADSIRRIDLEEQLKNLKAGEVAKSNELKKQLNDIAVQDSVRKEEKKLRIDSLRDFVHGYGVAPFFEDTLFYIYSRLGSFGPKERAAAIAARIEKLGSMGFGQKDSLKIVSNEQIVDITFGEYILLSVSDDDALWANSSKEAMAVSYQDIITKSLHQYESSTSLKTILKDVALALLVVIVLVFIIKGINRLKRWLKRIIVQQRGSRIKGISIRNYTLLDEDKLLNFFALLVNILSWLLIFTAIYISLPILFSIFPWTRGFADTLFGYFLTPVKKILLNLWDFLPKLVTIIVIVIVFRFLIRGLRFLKDEIATGKLKLPGFYADWATPTFQIVKILVLAFMVVVIFPYLPGSDSQVFRGVSVFLGVLFTFGSAGSLSNIIAGLVLTYMRAFKIGDRVKINDITGDIIEKTLLVTRIRTIKNEIISIPNSNVMNNHTTNYSSDAPDKGLILHTVITIGYDVSWRQVHQLLTDAALGVTLIEKDPIPFVLQLSLDDFYISYQLNAYTKEANKQASIYSELHQQIQDKFNEAGVEIMSPHYSSLRDGNNTTIPENYVKPGYKSPPFNFNSNSNNPPS